MLQTELSPPAPSTRRCLRIFCVLLASHRCGCERGSLDGSGGDGQGTFIVLMRGRRAAVSVCMCVFPFFSFPDGLSLPARRRTQARGAGRGPERGQWLAER